MTHEKHLGFELELVVLKIVKALAWVPERERGTIVEHLSPAAVKRAVADQIKDAATM